MPDSFKTIKANSEGSFKDKGSKFLAFAFPVENELEVNEFRAELRKKYFDARHHVYAFKIGIEKPVYRASDDGEPSNSSGPPVLGQIRSYGLTNILIVVVRYFGGTKLGIPGLINAYKSAARDAIDHAIIIEKNEEFSITLEFQYVSMNEIMRVLKTDGVKILSQQFDLDCRIDIKVSKSIYQYLKEKLQKIPKVKISIP